LAYKLTKMNKAINYDEIELYTLMNKPWEIADKPYLLFTAYALSCLYEALEDEEEEDNSMWGKIIPEKIFNSVVRSSVENFNDAAQNDTKIDIWGRPYSIRRANSYDSNLLDGVFQFEHTEDGYIVSKEGVIKLNADKPSDYNTDAEILSRNKLFLRRIVLLAESEDANGWDKLTDMELIVYCWAQHYFKCADGELTRFYREYKDYIYPKKSAIFSCINERMMKHGKPASIYAFDHDKVMKWNEENGQPSVVDDVPKKEADDFWYEVAVVGTFKP